jgi:hypothetical protein
LLKPNPGVQRGNIDKSRIGKFNPTDGLQNKLYTLQWMYFLLEPNPGEQRGSIDKSRIGKFNSTDGLQNKLYTLQEGIFC